jgi:hypothetical protein
MCNGRYMMGGINKKERMKTDHDYKALRGAVILERYQEKESRSNVEEPEEGLQAQLDEVFYTTDILILDDLIDQL